MSWGDLPSLPLFSGCFSSSNRLSHLPCQCPLVFASGYLLAWASLVAQMVKNPPAMQEIWVSSLGQEDLLEKRMATHSSILAWEIPWTVEPGGLQSMGSQKVRHDLVTNPHTHTSHHALVLSWHIPFWSS